MFFFFSCFYPFQLKAQVSVINSYLVTNVLSISFNRISQAVAALLRRLGLAYLGNESYGKIRIHGVAVKRWFKPKLASPFSVKPMEVSLSESQLAKGISNQQRNIRIGNFFLEQGV